MPPLGRLDPAQLRALAEVSRHAVGEVRLSVWRTVTVPDLSPADAGRAAADLEGLGLACDARTGWLGLSACAGADGCAESRERRPRDREGALGSVGPSDPPEHYRLPAHGGVRA